VVFTKSFWQQHFLYLCIHLSYTFPRVVSIIFFCYTFLWFNPYIGVSVTSQELDFQHYMSWSHCVQLVRVRGDCSFCWYWWNCWPSLFKLSLHNVAIISMISIFTSLWSFNHFNGRLSKRYTEEFEDTKEVIRIRNSPKYSEHNGQKNKQLSTEHYTEK
jgi:hypothetical protein